MRFRCSIARTPSDNSHGSEGKSGTRGWTRRAIATTRARSSRFGFSDEHRGGGEEIADLTAEEELNALKRYRPKLVVLNDKAVLERVVDKFRSHV